MQAPDKSTIEKEKNGRYCCCCCADCSANGLARIRNYNRTFENKNKMNAVSEDDAVSTTVFAVLRRDHIVTEEEDIAPACRPTALCFTHTEDMAEDAVDEYAVSAFQKAVPEWKRPNGAAPDASPLDIAAEQWEDESNTWGGRIVDPCEMAGIDGAVGPDIEAGHAEPQAGRLKAFDRCLGSGGISEGDDLLDHLFSSTKLLDEDVIAAAMEMTPEQPSGLKEPFLDLAAALYEPMVELREERKARKGRLDGLLAAMLEVRREFLGQAFIPDANGTLRLTYGTVEGYFPRDAVRYRPLTSVQGLMEKHTGESPFALPEQMRQLITDGDFGTFGDPNLGGVPVNLLYSADTTGGNSGSPVLDARGRVVGLNFDRAWEATINDFAWDHSYSRSIGVDIRYVLWVTWKFGGGDRLLAEMGVVPEG